jgi:GntR family transcriptional regulator, trigonelline degradation regulator
LRGLLEAEAACGFAQHSPRDVIMAPAFYEILFACAGKQVAWDVVQSLNARINHLRAMTIHAGPRQGRECDADDAHRTSADHVRKVAELARNALTSGDAASNADQQVSSRGQ